MKQIKKKKKCLCDGWAMIVILENLPQWIKDKKEADIESVYYCNKCGIYLIKNMPRSNMI